MLFKSQYTRYLESRILELEKSLTASNAYAQQLVERLLQKQGIAPVLKPVEPEAVDKLLRTADIFDDLDSEDEIEDTRKESVDAFAS